LNGDEIKLDRVLWTILVVQNKARAWNRGTAALNGLAWGDSEVDGETDWQATPIIGGVSIATSSGEVNLTDVVGDRIVTLKAETTINGVPITETIDVSFGKGPLSVFGKPPSTGGLPWATANRIPIIDKKMISLLAQLLFLRQLFVEVLFMLAPRISLLEVKDWNRVRLILVVALFQAIGGTVISIQISIIQLPRNSRLLASSWMCRLLMRDIIVM
jgi:hypothetical protein